MKRGDALFNPKDFQVRYPLGIYDNNDIKTFNLFADNIQSDMKRTIIDDDLIRCEKYRLMNRI